jgi:hypothetical protein
MSEASRDARGTAALDALTRDTRHGLRRLVRDWRFTTAAVLILGLAIGANTAIFSVVNAVLFRDPPFADPDRLVDIYQNDRAGKPLVVISYAAYMEMAEYTDIFAATMAATIPVPARYLHEGGIRGGTAEYATATYLDVLGLRPSLGRWFDATEERPKAPLVAVLGHQMWTRVFRADPSIIGRVVRIEGAPVTIVGIGGVPSMIWAGPGFFETLRIRLLGGRVFDARDRAGTPRVAVVTETMARRYFGAVDAVGRRFRIANDPDSWTEVIGVVRDTGPRGGDGDVLDSQRPVFYRSYAQSGLQPTTVIARTSGDAAGLVGAMQRELRAVDVTLPVMTAQTMAQDLELSQAAPAAVATFLGALGGLGLVLASIGLYAVVAFAVARRSREIGIRMALGARSQQVVWNIARGVAGLIGVGTGIGLALSVLVILTLRASSSGEADIGIGNIDVYRPTIDPVALLAIAAVTAVVGVAAAFVPGRRAALMDPLVALRHE